MSDTCYTESAAYALAVIVGLLASRGPCLLRLRLEARSADIARANSEEIKKILAGA